MCARLCEKLKPTGVSSELRASLPSVLLLSMIAAPRHPNIIRILVRHDECFNGKLLTRRVGLCSGTGSQWRRPDSLPVPPFVQGRRTQSFIKCRSEVAAVSVVTCKTRSTRTPSTILTSPRPRCSATSRAHARPSAPCTTIAHPLVPSPSLSPLGRTSHRLDMLLPFPTHRVTLRTTRTRCSRTLKATERAGTHTMVLAVARTSRL